MSDFSTMDSFAEIGVFTKVVDLGGFTKAAANLGLTPSGVSRVLSRLEERLGARLLNRTTRSLSLTDEGAEYYERCTPASSRSSKRRMRASRRRALLHAAGCASSSRSSSRTSWWGRPFPASSTAIPRCPWISPCAID